VAQAQAPPPAPANGSRLISFDFKDADVVNLLRILAAEAGRNIVIGDDVKGKMSISLRNVPWDLALETILETRGLRKIEKDGVLRIVSNEQLIKERETALRVEEARLKAENEIKAKKAEAELKEQEALDKKRAAEQALEELRARGDLKEETIRLSYADPEDIAKTLQGILGIPPEGVQAQIAPPLYSPAAGPPNPELRPVPSLITSSAPPPLPAPVGSPSAEVLAKGITIRAHKPTNSIFIRHYERDLERIKKLIREKLDIQLPQVKIEARMEILDRNDLFAVGVKWGLGGVATSRDITLVGRGLTTNQTASGIAPFGIGSNTPNPNLTLTTALPVTAASGLENGGNVVQLPIANVLGGGTVASGVGGLAFGIIGSRVSLNLALEALKQEGKTRTLARPEVVTVENGKASISLGEEIPYATVSSAGTQIQFKEALLKLDVTPTVIKEPEATKIKLKVLVENNSRSNTTVNLGTSAGAPPVINRRKAETEVLIKEGERLVIGGVTNNADQTEETKVPLFGDIPVIGWLFKQRASLFTGRELVVFITPSVLKNEMAKAAAAMPAAPAPKK
jgi:type IV pilus assembly protein PilQ